MADHYDEADAFSLAGTAADMSPCPVPAGNHLAAGLLFIAESD
jgi:hypothetical protein